MKKAAKAMAHPVRVLIESEVARQVRQHSRSSMKAEVCGVLIGREEGSLTIVDACIAGANAAQGGAHVTFTQDTWEHIYQVKDKTYPDARIVGWYHSHPGFGVFLSEHDLFIHEHFFSSPQQIAWVYDPHNDEEGCFGWRDKKIAKIDDVSVRFGRRCEEALSAIADDEQEVIKVKAPAKQEEEMDVWGMLRHAMICLTFAAIGGAAVFFWISNKMVVLPRGEYALVIGDKAVLLPPPIAEAMLQILDREAHEQMEQMMHQMQQPASAQPAAPAGNKPAQGAGDDRKK